MAFAIPGLTGKTTFDGSEFAGGRFISPSIQTSTSSPTGRPGRFVNGQWEHLLGPSQSPAQSNPSPNPNLYYGSSNSQSSSASSPGTYQANFSTVYPNAAGTQSKVSDNTMSRLRGELSPETLNAIQDSAARFGIGSGTPGSGVSGSYGRKLLGTTIEGLQSQGLNDYLNTLKTYSGTLMPTTGELIGADTSRYGIDVGAATSRYGTDVGARTSASALGENARQFDIGNTTSRYGIDVGARTAANSLSEQRRQADIDAMLRNAELGIQGANVGANHLNSYLDFLK